MPRTIFFNIETIPPESREGLDMSLISKLEKKWCGAGETIPGECDEATFRRLARYGEFGRILCIGVIVEEEGLQTVQGVYGRIKTTGLFHCDEARTLRSFYKLLEGFNEKRDVLVLHNAVFDLRFLAKRSAIFGVKPSIKLSVPKYQVTWLCDTMRLWDGYEWKPGLNLEELARVLRINKDKEGMDRSSVYDLYLEGTREAHQKIADNCMKDVEIARAAYDRMMFRKQAGEEGTRASSLAAVLRWRKEPAHD